MARISAVTRWLTAGVVALSGALALLAAQAFHGRTLSNGSTATATPVTQTSTWIVWSRIVCSSTRMMGIMGFTSLSGLRPRSGRVDARRYGPH